MPTFRLALVLALLLPVASVADIVVNMPSVGFRYTTQMHVDTGTTSNNSHTVLKREVVASDGTTIQTRNEGTIAGSDREFATSGKTSYRLFFPIDIESTAQPVPDQPPFTNKTTWDCPAEGFDQFYPRGTAAQVSLECKLTETLNGRVMGPQSFTVRFSDLGQAQDTTLAGTFEVRKIVVHFGAAGITNEITYDFAPALGISVLQETKVSTPRGETAATSAEAAANDTGTAVVIMPHNEGSALGHEEKSRPAKPKACFILRKRTFALTRANDADAPKAAAPGTVYRAVP